MLAAEKQAVWNLLKTASSSLCAYVPRAFSETPSFSDDAEPATNAEASDRTAYVSASFGRAGEEWVYRGRVTGFAQNSKVNLELDWAYTFAAAPDEGEAEDSGDESIQEEKPAPGYVMNAGCLLRYRIIESW